MEILICLTIDIDPDDATDIWAVPGQVAHWESLSKMETMFSFLGDNGVPATIFVRIDTTIARQFGDYLHIYRTIAEHLDTLHHSIASKFELGWHVHLLKVSEAGTRRFTSSEADQCEAASQLKRLGEHLNHHHIELRSVRIGEGYFTPRFIPLLSNLGFTVDSSAIPGRVWRDHHRQIDWRSTANFPDMLKAPSHLSEDGTAENWIWEVPMTSVAFKAPYDHQPLPRYLNPLYSSQVFDSMVHSLFGQRDWLMGHCGVITLVLHPAELFGYSPPHPLITPGLDILKRNMEFLLSYCSAASDRVTFVTTGAVTSYL